jgi:hypothetical protein
MKSPLAFALVTLLAASAIGCDADRPAALAVGAQALEIPMTTRDLAEVDATVPNPERGYYTRINLLQPAQAADIAEDGLTLALAIVKLDAYRDRPLDAVLLAQLETGLAAVRAAGLKVILRFRYNSGYVDDAPREIILQHIAQLAPLFEANEDVIAVVQAGFIGAWGEWHHSTHGLDNDADRALILGALLDALPVSRSVQVRTPMQKAAALGGPLAAAEAGSGSDRSRVGHHNDCFLATDDDYGTFAEPIAEWRGYVAQDAAYVPVGGETCQINWPRTDCDNAVDELAELGFSYLNEDYEASVIEAWEDQGCGEPIRRRLGYRLWAERLVHTREVAPGGELAVTIQLTNGGFAAPFNARPVAITLTRGAARYVAELEGRDVRGWRPGPITLAARLRVPADAPAGDYELGLWLPDAAEALRDDARYAIRLANDGWTDDGVNRLSEVAIDPSAIGAAAPDLAAIGAGAFAELVD